MSELRIEMPPSEIDSLTTCPDCHLTFLSWQYYYHQPKCPKEARPIKLYHYQFQTSGTNATILVTVRTDKGETVADELANAELYATGVDVSLWWLEDVTEEDF